MTYIFTAPQLAGVIQQALKTDDPLVLENVAFLAELFYQDEKENIKELIDQAIDAYRDTDIYEITDDNEEQIIGTRKDKMNALANYLRRVADDIEERD